jgi:DnaK suppressor protein
MSVTSALPETRTTVQHQFAAYGMLLEDQRRNQIAEITRLSLDALDPAGCDADSDGSRTEDLRVTSQLIAAARQQLDDTEAALRRIDDGSFGSCARCRQPIPAERLEILPAARFCVGCQQLHCSRR